MVLCSGPCKKNEAQKRLGNIRENKNFGQTLDCQRWLFEVVKLETTIYTFYTLYMTNKIGQNSTTILL